MPTSWENAAKKKKMFLEPAPGCGVILATTRHMT
jgi:hypothetical protein